MRRRAAAVVRSFPASIDGLNYRDPIGSLKPTEALLLDNYFPSTTSLRLRGGFTAHKTGFASAVETLMEYANTSGRKLFAAAGTAIYDATASGAVGAAVVSSLANARWQHVQFNNDSGSNFLILVNGVDGVRTYDGTTWATQTITGATATTFKNVCVFSRRLWFTANSDTKVYYLGTGAVAGAAGSLDLGQQWQLGGVLAFAAPISFSGGSEIEPMIAFVSTNGEVLLYRGDPGDVFALVGRFRCGRPTGDRGHLRFGGDVVMLTEYGIVSLMALTQVGIEKAPRASFSNKIDRVLTEQRRLYSSSFGFQLIDYPQGTMAMVNVPQSGGQFVQYAINTLTGAWCRFTGQQARCWGLLAENLYFGGATAVYKADTGGSDNGAAIQGEIKAAFTRMGFHGNKRFTMMRPLLTANGNPTVVMGLDVDYSDVALGGVSLSQTTEAAWDTGVWGTMLWGGASALTNSWFAVPGIGIAAALRMKTSTIGMEMQLHGVDVMFEPVSVTAL